MLSRKEKERRIIDLYEQGATYKTIAKEVHVSPGYISSIIRRHTGEQDVKGGNGEQRQREETIDSQVFKIFEAGGSPVQVAIDLGLKSDVVTGLYRQWWELKGLHQSNKLHEETKDQVFELHKLYELITNERYTLQQVIEAAKHLEGLSLQNSQHEQLIQENRNLERQNQCKTKELNQKDECIVIANQNLNTSKLDLARIEHEKGRLESIIASTYRGPGYKRLQTIAEASSRAVLADHKTILMVAISSVVQALKEDPDMQLVISRSQTYPTYGGSNTDPVQNHLILHNTKILEMSGQIFEDLLAICVRNAISSALHTSNMRP